MVGKKTKALGTDVTCRKCKECGGYPVVVKTNFSLRNGKFEERCYYHCPCGSCNTEYQRPLYRGRKVVETCVERARRAWQQKKFVRVDIGI